MKKRVSNDTYHCYDCRWEGYFEELENRHSRVGGSFISMCFCLNCKSVNFGVIDDKKENIMTVIKTEHVINDVPEGFMVNEKGYHVPIDKVKPIDLLRDEIVHKMAKKAKAMNQQLATDKKELFEELRSFLDLSAAEYDTEFGGKKGNLSLPSFDGKYKVKISMQDHIVFDERLQVAQELIHECIEEWGRDSNKNILTLVNDAFQVDKEGKVSTSRVLGLRRHDFKHPKWTQAMEAIADAMQVVSTTEYMRFYERDEHNAYQLIPLDFSKV